MHKTSPAALLPFAPPPHRRIAARARALARAKRPRVTITRDDWGIAHVHGKTDADAVFGMIYAQAEDDFPRIEANYLTNLGRTAEAEGEKAIWQDLRARLYVSDHELKAYYAASPQSMRRLMDAWADGLNYFLATHPDVKPRVLTRFEPWMALSFTEGSIGGDIERIDLDQLEAFYSGKPTVGFAAAADPEPHGSNGIAIAPKLTADGNALLLINPHTSYFFRSELQMTSDQGLNVYGAATWGQFFIYQGFNAPRRLDAHVERRRQCRRVRREGRAARHGLLLSLRQRRAARWACGRSPSAIARADGQPGDRAVSPPHAPIAARSFAQDGERWIAFAMMDRPVEALQQSFLRTKADRP